MDDFIHGVPFDATPTVVDTPVEMVSDANGDAGNDTLDGGEGVDFISYWMLGVTEDLLLDFSNLGSENSFSFPDGRGGIDFVLNVEQLGLIGGAGNDVLVGLQKLPNFVNGSEGNDSLTGGNQDDNLDGGAGNDMLRGLEGADTIAGQEGSDVLYGGPGANLFIVGSHTVTDPNAVDVIADFETGIDKIVADGGLIFADLTFIARGNDLLIKTFAGNHLALLIGISPTQITADDFLFPIIG